MHCNRQIKLTLGVTGASVGFFEGENEGLFDGPTDGG